MSAAAPKISATLKEAIDKYSAPALRIIKFLVVGGNDLAAVSDGTMGCHEKDVHHLVPVTRARRVFEDRRLLDAVVKQIADCDAIVAASKQPNFTPDGMYEQKLMYLTPLLEDAWAEIAGQLPDGYASMVSACLELRNADVWVNTVYDKAVNVRARRIIPGKADKELAVQNYVIADMENRFPAEGRGYPADLGRALRRTKALKGNLPVVDFAVGTLATIHKGYKDAHYTRFDITRILLQKKDGRTFTTLTKAYTLYFAHKGGKLVYTDDLGAREKSAVGTAYAMESKFYADQKGDGFASADEEVWLAAVKSQPGIVLLSYLFSHSTYPADVTTDLDMMTVYTEASGIAVKEFDREEADNGLLGFDFSGGPTNPSLAALAAMALVPRPDIGAGAVKYINTKTDGFDYEEPSEPVGLSIHHIYTGTGEFSEAKTDACNRRHEAAGFPSLSVNLLVVRENAVPINNYRNYRKLTEAHEEGAKIEPERIIGDFDMSLFAKA